MKLSPYLAFNGNCAEAFQFYASCLGGAVESTFTFEGSPVAKDVPPEWRNKLMHARVIVGGHELMGADTPPGHYEQPKGFSVSIGFEKPEEAERAFHALAESGTVTLPYQKTFWSAGFGMLVDRFGIPWMINCDQAP
jgi:PhnB protein